VSIPKPPTDASRVSSRRATIRFARRRLRTIRKALARLTLRRFSSSLASRVRATTYKSGRGLKLVPPSLVDRWKLIPPAPGSRRLEIGSGSKPQPGYIHLDVDPQSPQLHFRTSGDRIPLPDDWADEILSIHMIEHVPPSKLHQTLREWRRVLRAGGTLEVHTPNGLSLAKVLIDPHTSSSLYWAAQSAIYGYGPGPEDSTGPECLGQRGDHRTLLTFPVLQSLLAQAGFSTIRDVSGENACYHLQGWAQYVPGLCLEVRALNPSVSGQRVG
jgi:hypothetical protein